MKRGKMVAVLPYLEVDELKGGGGLVLAPRRMGSFVDTGITG